MVFESVTSVPCYTRYHAAQEGLINSGALLSRVSAVTGKKNNIALDPR